MKAEARRARLPAEALAVACFAWVETIKLDAMKRVGLHCKHSLGMRGSKRTGSLRKSCQFEADCRHRLGSADVQRVLAIRLAPPEADSSRMFCGMQQTLFPLTGAFGVSSRA
jgi:hypothetical protein